MTALSEYQRLECSGLWRERPDAQRREVIVTFGDATIMLKETPSERALTHWSLPAVERRNPGEMPALFGPGDDAGEELEIDDETMIAAIGKVHAILRARRPHPGRLRGALLLGSAAVIMAALAIWVPGALVAHTARVLPVSTREAVGRATVAELARVAGTPCAGEDAAPALAAFTARLAGPHGQVVVFPEGLTGALALPGGIIAIGRPVIEGASGPEIAAGYVLAAQAQADAADPLLPALGQAGLSGTFQLLTGGTLPAGALRGLAETLLTEPPPAAPDAATLARFARAGVPSSPYAYALDPSGESTLGLIEADPFATAAPPAPVLTDTEWVALQGICG